MVDVELAVLRKQLHAYEAERVKERNAMEERIRRQQEAINILDKLVAEQAAMIGKLRGQLEEILVLKEVREGATLVIEGVDKVS